MAGMGPTIGGANVRIIPHTKDFRPRLKRYLDMLERGLKAKVGLELNAKGFPAAVRAAVQSAQAAAGNVHVNTDVDTSRLFHEVKRSAEEVSKAAHIQLKTDLDRAKLGELAARLKASTKAMAKIELEPVVNPADLHSDLARAINAAEAATGNLKVAMEADARGLVASARRAVAIAQAAAGKIHVGVDTRRNAISLLAGAGAGLLGAVGALAKFSALAGGATVAVSGLAPAIAAVGTATVGALGPALALTAAMTPAALGAVGLAVGTVAQAFKGMGAAINAAGADELADALAELPPAAQGAALALRDLKSGFSGMGDEIKQSFWEPLQNLGQLSVFLEPLRAAMTGLAADMGSAASGVVDFISQGPGLEMVTGLITESQASASNLAQAFLGVIPGITAVGAAAAPFFTQLTAGINEAASAWSERMVAAFQDGSLQQFFEDAISKAKELWEVISHLGGIVSGVWTAMSNAGQPFLGTLGQIIAKTDEWVNSAEGMATLESFFRAAGDAVSAILPAVGEVAGIIGGTLAPAVADLVQGAAPGFVTFLQELGKGLDQIAPVMPVVGEAIGRIFGALAPLMEPLGRLVAELLPPLAELLASAVEGFSKLLGWLEPLWPVILGLAAGFALLNWPILLVVAAVVALLAAFDWLTDKVTEAWEWIKAKFSEGKDWAVQKLTELAVGMAQKWEEAKSAAITKVTEIYTSVTDWFNRMKTAVIVTVSGWVSSIKAKFDEMRSSLSAKASEIWNTVSQAFSNGVNRAVSFVRELPGRARAALGNAGSALVESGRALIQGFINGIRSMIGAVAGAAKAAVQAARDFFPFSPAKKGPFSGHGYTLYSGRALGRDFAGGIEDTAADAAAASGKLAAAAHRNLAGYRADAHAVAAVGASAGGRGGGGGDYSIHIDTYQAADMSKPVKDMEEMQLKQRIRKGDQ